MKELMFLDTQKKSRGCYKFLIIVMFCNAANCSHKKHLITIAIEDILSHDDEKRKETSVRDCFLEIVCMRNYHEIVALRNQIDFLFRPHRIFLF